MNTLKSSERPGPGRPREFDPDDAVIDAIEVFRTRGYHGTSIDDLTKGTGLARGSIYKAFNDKHSLFVAALEHYIAGSLKRLANDLAQPGSAKDALRHTLMGYAERAASQDGQRSCLVTGAAMEMVPEDPAVSAAIARLFRRTQDLFAATVIRAQATGEIAPDRDERAIARHLYSVTQGMRMLGKLSASKDELAQIVDEAMRSLD